MQLANNYQLASYRYISWLLIIASHQLAKHSEQAFYISSYLNRVYKAFIICNNENGPPLAI